MSSPIVTFDLSLSDHCAPTTPFLNHYSRAFNVCVPTPLAFVSTLLGCLSVASWLFAQMPQVYKNWRLHSTSGLSIYFLAEWLLGDATNLLGCIFTGQATWQIVLAVYYCFVDIMLVAQWIWYEHLRHGRPWRRSKMADEDKSESSGTEGPMLEVPRQNPQRRPPIQRTPSKPIQSTGMGMFRMPRFSLSPSSWRRNGEDNDTEENDNATNSPPSEAANNRTIIRVGPTGASMGVSPRTVLYISMVLAVLSHTTTASPLNRSSHAFQPLIVSESPTEIAGRILSWLSTLAYLLSRMPQLYKNFARKSTTGLSPLLFIAAFFGNVFYSSSILTNPSAWSNFPPYGGHGWAGSEGSNQVEWVTKALPFWLGAAGVLIMDGAIGVQFSIYGDGGASQKPTVVVEEVLEDQPDLDTGGDGTHPMERSTQSIVIKRPWTRVNGWMRGWVPSVSVAGTPRPGTPRNWGSFGSGSGSGDEREGGEGRSIGDEVARWEERQRLLSARDVDAEEEEQARSYGAV